jgi:hypothetical protein
MMGAIPANQPAIKYLGNFPRSSVVVSAAGALGRGCSQVSLGVWSTMLLNP